MEKTVLEEITERLADRYGSGRHFEVINANGSSKDGSDWTWELTIKEVKVETDKSEEKQ